MMVCSQHSGERRFWRVPATPTISVQHLCNKHSSEGASHEKEWNNLLSKYGEQFPKEHADLTRRMKGELPEGWQKSLPVYTPSDSAVASRKLSETVLSKIESVLPELFGGSAVSFAHIEVFLVG